MAEERPPASLKKPPKPTSQKPEKPHRISPVEGKELKIPLQKFQPGEPPVFGHFASGTYRNWLSQRYLASVSPIASEISLLSVSDPDVEQPVSKIMRFIIKVLEYFPQDLAKKTPLLHQPKTIMFMTRSSLIVSTEYQGKKQPPEPPLTMEMLPEDPPLVLPQLGQPEELEPEMVASDYGKAKSESSGSKPAESSKPQVKQSAAARRAASIKSGAVAREIGKELDEKQGEFFHVTPLTKQIEHPPQVSQWLHQYICIALILNLYHRQSI